MKNWIERTFGICFHDWKFVDNIMSAGGHNNYYEKTIQPIILGERMVCRKCNESRDWFYPDGH